MRAGRFCHLGGRKFRLGLCSNPVAATNQSEALKISNQEMNFRDILDDADEEPVGRTSEATSAIFRGAAQRRRMSLRSSALRNCDGADDQAGATSYARNTMRMVWQA
jgi:hypothetical protein